jgi:predicted CXXCH cytochrome family protein
MLQMTRALHERVMLRGVLSLLIFALGGCVDEKVVFRDGPNFTQPAANAASFLGYSDLATNKTVCGSCHVTQQGKWQSTAHAEAFKTLEASGSMQGVCQACHTVNNLGNATTDTTAGWRSTKDTRYHDVQCESCHGPGLQHVTAPTRGQMLASIHADTGRAITNGCAECHAGTHHPFVEEWRKTRHATSANDHVYNATSGTPPTPPDVFGGPRSSCRGCHIGQFVLESWGVTTNFVEKGKGLAFGKDDGVTCVVCHDPHGSGNPKQLRYPVDSRDPTNNLCTRCHDRGSAPNFSSSRPDEPHAPHGPLVFGTAGWWPPGIEFEETESSHGSDRNPKLCAGCHVQNYSVTDQATNKFQIQVVGHRFLPIPCVDANGAPVDSQPAYPAACVNAVARSYKSCAASGCHSEATARSAIATAEADIAGLTGALDAMIAQVPASQKLPAAAGKVTVARGATFNSNLAKTVGAEAHNPFLVKALLRASIAAVAKEYNIQAPPGLNLAPYDRLLSLAR